MTASSLYQSVAIDPDDRNIRLIELETSVNGIIQGRFHVSPLESETLFVALSYEWGLENPTRLIVVDGNQLTIRNNLWLALCKILEARNVGGSELQEVLTQATYSRPMLIWVDAICVDQGNIEERNAQVAMMRDIYQRAVVVLVWLGLETSDSELAIKHISRGGRFLESQPQDSQSLQSLLSRTYWERMWIVQEFLLGPKVLILCGDEVFWWQLLHQTVQTCATLATVSDSYQVLFQSLLTTPGSKITQAKHNHLEVMSEERRMAAYNLDNLILHWSSQKCKDPRDKVFALLGLPFHPFKWKRGSVVADYNKTVEEVYCDVLSTLRFTIFVRDTADLFCARLAEILGVSKFEPIVRDANEKIMVWYQDEKEWYARYDPKHARIA